MLKALLLLLTTALAVMAKAQNLVPNPSFEDTMDCDLPTQCSLLKAQGWSNPTQCTPDLYDCDLDRTCGYPMNLAPWNGYLVSEDGSRHAGAFLWDGPGSSTREYLMCRLDEPLVAGQAYRMSLWYALRLPFQYAIDHIGVWFGADSLSGPGCSPLVVAAQVELRDASAPFLLENNWTELVDTMIAMGGEQWMVLGNFMPIDSVNGTLANPGGIYSTSYYYLDNVSVGQLASSAIQELRPVAWWNGTGITLAHIADLDQVDIAVLDLQGRLLYHARRIPTSERIELPYLSMENGVYIIRLRLGNGWTAIKFVKEGGGL